MGDGLGYGPLENVRARLNVDNLFGEDVLAFTSTKSNAFFGPLNPRTIQVSLTAEN